MRQRTGQALPLRALVATAAILPLLLTSAASSQAALTVILAGSILYAALTKALGSQRNPVLVVLGEFARITFLAVMLVAVVLLVTRMFAPDTHIRLLVNLFPNEDRGALLRYAGPVVAVVLVLQVWILLLKSERWSWVRERRELRRVYSHTTVTMGRLVNLSQLMRKHTRDVELRDEARGVLQQGIVEPLLALARLLGRRSRAWLPSAPQNFDLVVCVPVREGVAGSEDSRVEIEPGERYEFQPLYLVTSTPFRLDWSQVRIPMHSPDLMRRVVATTNSPRLSALLAAMEEPEGNSNRRRAEIARLFRRELRRSWRDPDTREALRRELRDDTSLVGQVFAAPAVSYFAISDLRTEPLVMATYESVLDSEERRAYARSAAAVPLDYGNKRVGVLLVMSPRRGAFDRSRLGLVREVADAIAALLGVGGELGVHSGLSMNPNRSQGDMGLPTGRRDE